MRDIFAELEKKHNIKIIRKTNKSKSMRVILKYALAEPFSIPSVATISMKIGSQIVSIAEQSNIPTVWCIVDTEQDGNEYRYFALIPTGSTSLDHYQIKNFLGTVLLHNGQYVLHIFEIEKPSL